MTSPFTASATPTTPSAPAAVDALIEVGLGWARYGLMTGRLAVQTHAALLRSTASLLDEAATLLDARLHTAGQTAPTPPSPGSASPPS